MARRRDGDPDLDRSRPAGGLRGRMGRDPQHRGAGGGERPDPLRPAASRRRVSSALESAGVSGAPRRPTAGRHGGRAPGPWPPAIPSRTDSRRRSGAPRRNRPRPASRERWSCVAAIVRRRRLGRRHLSNPTRTGRCDPLGREEGGARRLHSRQGALRGRRVNSSARRKTDITGAGCPLWSRRRIRTRSRSSGTRCPRSTIRSRSGSATRSRNSRPGWSRRRRCSGRCSMRRRWRRRPRRTGAGKPPAAAMEMMEREREEDARLRQGPGDAEDADRAVPGGRNSARC